MNWPNKLLALALIGVAMLTACIVTPKPVQDNQASFEGNEQTSGFLGFANGFGIITPHARDRYNLLISTYSNQFNPPLRFDAGLLTTNLLPHGAVYLIDKEHLVKFASMNRWKKTENISNISKE